MRCDKRGRTQQERECKGRKKERIVRSRVHCSLVTFHTTSFTSCRITDFFSRTLHGHRLVSGLYFIYLFIFAERLHSGSGCLRTHATPTVSRMGVSLHFSLALFLLFSSPVRAQWLSLFWAMPKVSTTSPPLSPAATAASVSSAVPPGGWPTTESGVVAADGSREDGAHTEVSVPPSPAAESPSTAPGTSPPEQVAGGVSRSRAQHKPLRQWKSGEEMRLFIPPHQFLVHFDRGASSFA